MGVQMCNEPDPVVRARAFAASVAAIKRTWRELYGEELVVAGESSEGQFNACLLKLKQRVTTPEELERWSVFLDVDKASTIVQVVEKIVEKIIVVERDPARISEVDDLAFNQFRSAALEVARRSTKSGIKVKLPYHKFLRDTLDIAMAKSEDQLNVGPNRHLLRLVQWTRQLNEQFDEEVFRLQNAGRGPVAAVPKDPKRLVLVIDPDYLPKASALTSNVSPEATSKAGERAKRKAAKVL